MELNATNSVLALVGLAAVLFAIHLMRRLSKVERKEDCLIKGQDALIAKVELLEKKLSTDALTLAMTRGPGTERLIAELERAKRHNSNSNNRDVLTVGVIMFDLDHFKQKNDDYGHLAGDAVLEQVIGLLLKNKRKSDFIIRWGGEEFVIIFPEVTADDLLDIAKKLRKLVAEFTVQYEGLAIKVTISVGVTTTDGTEPLEVVILRADKALYKAKGPKGSTEGRNRVMYDFAVNGCGEPALAVEKMLA
jgi:diguanylate cyclase (GGDEF)-like protein